MGFREFLERTKVGGNVVSIAEPVSKALEAGGVLKALDGRPVLMNRIKESSFPIAGNFCSTKGLVGSYFGIEPEGLIPKMLKAIDNPIPPQVIEKAPCQEVEIEVVDLDQLPILFHCEKDGGTYVTSGVAIATDAEYGQNMDFHRLMQIGPNRFSVRVVASRHFGTFLKRQKRMPVAVCIGNGPNVLLAAATSVALGQDELEIASALEPLRVVKARTFDAHIPADCEFVLEGTIDLEERAPEGPFVDLTGTYDKVREEPVFTVTRITHRKDAIWQALLPSGLEHKLLMGMPREPTIYREVVRAGVRCLDVNVNPGGCSWLHAIVRIEKQKDEDGKLALEAAFKGHGSLKHCLVVDHDINIYDHLEVEWAMATRFQGDRDIFVKGREPGSSLDPSGDQDTGATYKMGCDLTKPLSARGGIYEKAAFPNVNMDDYSVE